MEEENGGHGSNSFDLFCFVTAQSLQEVFGFFLLLSTKKSTTVFPLDELI